MATEANERFVVKFRRNPRGTRVLANELIAGAIAHDMGVPCPEGVIVEIDAAFARHATGAIKSIVEPGDHFGTSFVEAWETPPIDIIYKVRNRDTFSGIVVFDILTLNADRDNPDNYLIHYVDRSPYLVVFDHGDCFGEPNWDETIVERAGSWTRKVIPQIAECIQGNDPFSEAITKARAITADRFEEIVDQVPIAWGVSKRESDALREFLVKQQGCVERILETHTSTFPHWK